MSGYFDVGKERHSAASERELVLASTTYTQLHKRQATHNALTLRYQFTTDCSFFITISYSPTDIKEKLCSTSEHSGQVNSTPTSYSKVTGSDLGPKISYPA